MAAGLIALLDDIAAIAKVAAASLDDIASQTAKTASAALDDVAVQAAKAGAKAAGVVIDDAAVTPRYVVGFSAARELPIVGRVAWGSLKNKLLILLPGALLLSAVAPWAITPLLMLGGLYLCFEGYEKLHHMVTGHDVEKGGGEAAMDAKSLEDSKVSGAIRTDMILSAEIMAITLATVADQSFAMKATVLAAVGLGITAAVYGAVALIVKADDAGVAMAKGGRLGLTRALGRGLVKGVPPFLSLLSIVGTLAMLWVGGGIILHSLAGYGFAGPEHAIAMVAERLALLVPVARGALAWLINAVGAGLAGVVLGAIVAVLVKLASPLMRMARG
jgi:predicted DNA repair protein MutK